ncbi:hypothetical protein ACLKA6_002972 [Drosophila palustris]
MLETAPNIQSQPDIRLEHPEVHQASAARYQAEHPEVHQASAARYQASSILKYIKLQQLDIRLEYPEQPDIRLSILKYIVSAARYQAGASQHTASAARYQAEHPEVHQASAARYQAEHPEVHQAQQPDIRLSILMNRAAAADIRLSILKYIKHQQPDIRLSILKYIKLQQPDIRLSILKYIKFSAARYQAEHPEAHQASAARISG